MRSRLAAALVSPLVLAACTCGPAPSGPAASAQREPATSAAAAGSRWGGLSVELTGDEDARSALVLLHGYGAPGDDLVPLAASVGRAAGALAVVPAAPQPGEIGQGRQWWSLTEWRRRRQAGEDLSAEVPAGLPEASERIQRVLATLAEDGIPAERVVLAGFSQGAMLALDAGLRADSPVAGIVAMSGTLIAEERWAEGLEGRSGPPVLLTHGRNDPLLAFRRTEALARFLEGHGVDVELVAFDGGHAIPPVARRALEELTRRWLGEAP